MKVLIVIPVYNEEKIIKNNIIFAYKFFQASLSGYDWKILVADNCSRDLTGSIVKGLLNEFPNLEYLYFDQKGKGLAVLGAWQKYKDDFDIFAFMDADLSTDLSSFLPLIQAIENGFDLAIGSRYLKDSVVNRSALRKVISWFYRKIAWIILGTRIKDLPCGFKAVNRKVVKEIVPKVKNTNFFFDTELIYLAEKENYKIKEITIKWHELRVGIDKSKVNILRVSWLYLRELLKLRSRKYF